MAFSVIFKFAFIGFCVALGDAHGDHHGDFYGGFELENKCTTGMEQSPVNLEDLNFEFHDISSDLQFKHFDVMPLDITLSNTHDSGRSIGFQ